MISIPKEISFVLSRLSAHGFEAFVVGGCVRDILLGRMPSDWDICTAATPDKVQEIFQDTPLFLTGLKHGTVTILQNHQPIEVTTYRKDGDYTDHRHPSSVTYTQTLKEDLARRDFTVNAMAYSHRAGLMDFFGGQEDLKKNRLVCVGEPQKRFSEDALRILRGLRFASVYGFTIEEKTASAIHLLKDTLTNISAERIYEELKKTIIAPYFEKTLQKFPDVFATIFPDMTEVFAENNASFSHLPKDVAIRLAFLFLRHPDLTDAEKALHRLKADKKTSRRVLSLLQLALLPAPVSLPEMRRLVRDFGIENVSDFLMLKPEQNSIVFLTEIKEKNLCCSISDLAIDGKNILATGKVTPPKIGEMLNLALDAVMDEKVANEKSALLNFLFS